MNRIFRVLAGLAVVAFACSVASAAPIPAKSAVTVYADRAVVDPGQIHSSRKTRPVLIDEEWAVIPAGKVGAGAASISPHA